jgi:hypothetical protein
MEAITAVMERDPRNDHSSEGMTGILDPSNAPDRPLSALLSQALVAYTIELDDAFELGMAGAGYPGTRVSLVVWANLLRFVPDGGISFRELSTRSLAPPDRLKSQLGCLERWGFLQIGTTEGEVRKPASTARGHPGRRAGWGTGRGIAGGTTVTLTRKGRSAGEVWAPLWAEIDDRWEARFGHSEIMHLRETLEEIVGRFEVDLPLGLPAGMHVGEGEPYPPGSARNLAAHPLSALLSKALLMFAIEYNRESPTPLVLSANMIRVLGELPVRLGDVPRLTGGSPESSDVGWRERPYVVVEAEPEGGKGSVVRLSVRGMYAHMVYRQITADLEYRWETRYGRSTVRNLRASLERVLDRKEGGRSVLGEGLVPPSGTVRAGDSFPHPGSRTAGPAARRRGREYRLQAGRFVEDPSGSLPHYPLWDMTRGYGP